MLTVQRVYELIDALAPFDTQADFDNSGLLVGNPQAEVTGIHLALDVTDRVIDDALAAGANLIVTHHPLMFSARKRLTEADYEGHLLIRLIANGLSLIAAHTNLDQASGGMNDTLRDPKGGDIRYHAVSGLHNLARLLKDPPEKIDTGSCKLFIE